MAKEFKKPPVASWPVWKIVLAGLALSAIFIFLIWLFELMLSIYCTGVPKPMTIGSILLGNFWLLIALWTRWAYQPRRKHARWHRWLESLISLIYMFGLILSGAIAYWNALLKYPWNWVVNGVVALLFILAWILPAISYSAAKKLAQMQWALSGRMLGCAGVAGILGASFGMYASRNGEIGSVIFVVAILFSLLAIFMSQYGAEYLWRYRPWQKEAEE